jgi:hypothetical protein
MNAGVHAHHRRISAAGPDRPLQLIFVLNTAGRGVCGLELNRWNFERQ